MINAYLRRVFKIDELTRQVDDLKRTCRSLEKRVTVVHKELNDAVEVLAAFNLKENPDEPWWSEANTKNLTPDQWRLAHNIQRNERIRYVETHPSLKTHITFHGGCLGCVRPTIEGIGQCKGCQYLTCNWSDPDKRKTYADYGKPN